MSAEKLNPANPGPLGLLGFGMTTILLNLHNAEIIPLSIVIVAMGLALGGAAQIIAGILEFCHGNTFGGTAFVAYGFFWWSLVLIWVCPFDSIAAGDSTSLGFYLLLWGIFSLFMFNRYPEAQPHHSGGLWLPDYPLFPALHRRFHRCPRHSPGRWLRGHLLRRLRCLQRCGPDLERRVWQDCSAGGLSGQRNYDEKRLHCRRFFCEGIRQAVSRYPRTAANRLLR